MTAINEKIDPFDDLCSAMASHNRSGPGLLQPVSCSGGRREDTLGDTASRCDTTQAEEYWQDCQLIKERYEDSPGILLLAHGSKDPTPERRQALRKYNYLVVSASCSYQDDIYWLEYPECIGAILHDQRTVEWAQARYPDKIIERFEAASLLLLRTTTQFAATLYPLFSPPSEVAVPGQLKTIDIVGCWASNPIKRTELLVEAALEGDFSAYIISGGLGADKTALQALQRAAQRRGFSLEPFYLPFEPYALHKIGSKIFIDGRILGINNGLVSSTLDKARVYVHTSTTEGIANSIVEALLRNVPVVVCSDLRGPLVSLAAQMPAAITVCEPEPAAIARTVRDILRNYERYSNVRGIFRRHLDPFAVDARLVRRCQQKFHRMSLPWKGRCHGLLGAVPAKFNIAAEIDPWQQISGQRCIYPDLDCIVSYLEHQIDLAYKAGNRFAVRRLETEYQMVMDRILCVLKAKISS